MTLADDLEAFRPRATGWLRKLGAGDEAEDYWQEACLKIWRVHLGDPDRALNESYFRRAAVSVLINHRHRSRLVRWQALSGVETIAAPPGGTDSGGVDRLLDDLALSSAERQMLVYVLAGYRYRELPGGSSVGALKARMHRLRRRLLQEGKRNE